MVGGNVKSQTIGTWAPNIGLQLHETNMYERRSNLTGVTLVNSVLPWVTITIVEEIGGELRQSGQKIMHVLKRLFTDITFHSQGYWVNSLKQ